MLRGGNCPVCIFGDLLNEEDEAEETGAPPPQRVGDYELQEEIARGGMGVVWRAHQRRLNRRVALKFVLEGALPGETVARRFRQEAEVAARLSHPHIIAIHEVGEADGRYFICMELAEGGTLAQRLKSGPLEPRAAVELARKLARAVQHAHDRGVLHRDLKPANILFDAAGEPRVSDFGLAQLAADRDALTVTGAVLGTPSYMSPEQARGEVKGLTTAADVYGLGTIFYEMLAGRPAFAGEVPLEVLRRVVDEEPSPLTTGNRDLETVCRKCLAKEPGERYRSAGALADDLERWLAGEAILARRASPAERLVKWMRRRPALAALSFALVVAAVVIVGLIAASQVRIAEARGAAAASAVESQHRRADQHTTAAILALERGDSLRALPSLAAAIRIGTGDAARDRVNRIRFETTLRLAPRLEQMWFAQWLSDFPVADAGDRIVLCDDLTLRLLSTKDGSDAVPPIRTEGRLLHAALHRSLNRILTESERGDFGVWDAVTGKWLHGFPARFLDARFLFRAGAVHIAVWNGNTAQRYSLAQCRSDGSVLTHPAKVEWAYLCEGGRSILTFSADQKLRVWDAETGARTGESVSCGVADARFQGEQPGAHLAYVSTQQYQPGWLMDVEQGRLISRSIADRDVRAAAWISGRLTVARATRQGFAVIGDGNGEVAVTAAHGGHGHDAVFSADGYRILTRAVDGGSRLWSLQTGRAVTPFLWEAGDPLNSALDAAGKRILVGSGEQAVRLWQVPDRDGAAAESTVPRPSLVAEWMQKLGNATTRRAPFSRQGTNGLPTLLCEEGNRYVLQVRDPKTGREIVPGLRHQGVVEDAVFSPDGRRIASYTSNQSAYLWDAATGEQIGPLLRHDREISFLTFSPDSLLLLTAGVHTMRLWETATGTAAGPAMMHPDPVLLAWWNQDGTRIFSSDQRGLQREWDISPGSRTVEDLEILGHLYSAHRVTTGGALVPISTEESRAAWEAAKKKGMY